MSDPSLPEPFTPHSGAPGMGRVASGAAAAGGAQAHTPTLQGYLTHKQTHPPRTLW